LQTFLKITNESIPFFFIIFFIKLFIYYEWELITIFKTEKDIVKITKTGGVIFKNSHGIETLMIDLTYNVSFDREREKSIIQFDEIKLNQDIKATLILGADLIKDAHP
jgi:hypothetical protein